jgi:CubicO group peptidase (beta-lactamase class C family)
MTNNKRHLMVWLLGACLTAACHATPTRVDDLGALAPVTQQVANAAVREVQDALAKGAAPGAVVAVVEPGRVWMQGYGKADVATGRVMDPVATQVRIGSITKSFTALLIHQLIEQGRLSLDMPLTQMLKTEQPQRLASRAPTLQDLLTHRANFDGDVQLLSVTASRPANASPGWLGRQLIAVGEPGHAFVYDNNAYAALGRIVEEQLSTPLAQAMHAKIFGPLQMRDSVLGLPADRARLAGCYLQAGEGQRPCQPMALRQPVQGAGDMTSTAADMSRFIEMMISGGAVRDAQRLFSAERFAAFTSTSHRLHPMGPGVGLGVYQMGEGRSPAFGHSGGIRGGSSMMLISPQHKLGVFIHFNSSARSDEMSLTPSSVLAVAREADAKSPDPGALTAYQLPYQLAMLLPADALVPATISSDPACDASALSGPYVYSRVAGMAALGGRFLARALVPPVLVQRRPDGSLFADDVGPYDPVTPCHYRLRDKKADISTLDATLSFARMGNGELQIGSHPLLSMRRQSVWHSATVTVYPLIAALLWMLMAGAVGSVAQRDAVLRRVNRQTLAASLVLVMCFGLELEYGVSQVRETGVQAMAFCGAQLVCRPSSHWLGWRCCV